MWICRSSTFMLSIKAGKEAYVGPVIEGGGYHFTVKVGKPKDAEGAENGTKRRRAPRRGRRPGVQPWQGAAPETARTARRLDPATDKRLTVWEMVHHLVRVLESGAEASAGDLAKKLGGRRKLRTSSLTACTRFANGGSAPRKPSATMRWCKAGPEVIRLAGSRAASATQPDLLV
jgi:hypothetical protein